MAKLEWFHISEFNPMSYDYHKKALERIKVKLMSNNVEFEVRVSKQVGDTENLWVKLDVKNFRLAAGIRSQVAEYKRIYRTQ